MEDLAKQKEGPGSWAFRGSEREACPGNVKKRNGQG